MSNRALTHVFSLKVGSSTQKAVLVALANYADNETLEAYPCVVELCEATEFNRKAVLAALTALREHNFIIDTGKRKGSTRSVIVYKINLEAVPNMGLLEAESGTQSGTTKQSLIVPQAVPNQGLLKEGEAVPNCTTSSPQLSHKQSLIGDTEPSITINEPSIIKKTKAKKDAKNNDEKKPPDDFILPDWINAADWQGFLEMRMKIKKPPTDLAKKLLIEKLEKFKNDGHDPNQIIQRSIINDWQDIYEPRPQTQGKPNVSGKSQQPPFSRHTNFEQQDWYAGTEGFDVT